MNSVAAGCSPENYDERENNDELSQFIAQADFATGRAVLDRLRLLHLLSRPTPAMRYYL